GYFEARSLEFLTSGMNTFIEWIRFPGDVLFILGIIPVLYIAWIGVRHRVASVTLEEPSNILFTEVSSRDNS
ncbi:MAG: hypothetical protein P8Y78_13460, partial [Acidihalobacter sp.]